jgi:transposase
MSAEQSVLVEGLEERPEPLPVTGLGLPGKPRLPEASVLFQDWELRAVRPPNSEPPPPENLKLRVPNRDQLTWARIDLEELIPGDHKARAIWHLTGQLDLTRFREGLCTVKGDAGRAAWDPRLLVSIWIYMLSEGVNAAREIERLMEYEPGLMWLSGGEVINHHTLSDFRAQHKQALDDLFTRLLALLEGEGLVTLELVAHDGTKVEAQAGADSFRRERTVRERLERARKLLQDLEAAEPSQGNLRRQAAQRRAAREREARLEQALAELQTIQAQKQSEQEKQEARVSLTDPEARIMKHGDQAFGPAYNVQISTDAKSKVVVGMDLTQSSADAPALAAALEQVEQRTGELPKQVVVDGGYTSEDNILRAEAKQVDLIGSLANADKRTQNALKSSGIAPEFGPSGFVQIAETNSLQCPAGKQLPYARQSRKKHRRYRQYQAAAADCAACPLRAQCCPKNKGKGRTVSILVEEHPSMVAFREKMGRAEAQQVYKQRGAIAEFPNAWIKDKIGLRKFRLRGLVKAKTEALWACLTYNMMIWVRLVWRPKLVRAAA